MPLNENRVVLACAGSGKTTRLVEEALASPSRRIAIITYTNNNTREVIRRFGEVNSGVPKHVDVMTWFGFLLRECVRPYQRSKYTKRRIESLLFVNRQSTRGIAETNTRPYYFANDEFIFSDKIARFVVECEKKSSKSVTARIRQIYTDIFIDEFQDLAGWDLEIVDMLLRSGVRITLVGDPRQHIYSTNPSQKNKQFLGVNVSVLMEKWQDNRLCKIECMSGTHRCNQAICDFTNGLWPDMDPMQSLADGKASHAGVFLVAENMVGDYIHRFAPQVLRHNKNANSYGCEALNFGIVKGLQFERVLIIPTGPIKKYLQTGDLKHLRNSRERLHVAVTRARHSVAFVFDGESPIVQTHLA